MPILLLANVILGINTNLNMWYKMSDKTTYGIYITFVGLFFTVIGNFVLIPKMGIWCCHHYLSCLLCYVPVQFVWGQRLYPVPYNWSKISAFDRLLYSFALHYFPLADVSLKIGLGCTYLLVMIMVEREAV